MNMQMNSKESSARDRAGRSAGREARRAELVEQKVQVGVLDLFFVFVFVGLILMNDFCVVLCDNRKSEETLKSTLIQNSRVSATQTSPTT